MTREGISPREKNARACGRGRDSHKKRGPVRELASLDMRKLQKAWPCARICVSGDVKASLSAAFGRSGLGAGSAPGPLARQRRGFARLELCGRRSILARSGADFVAGAALSQGQLFLRFELRGRRSTFARSSAYFMAGAALSQGQVQI